MNVGAMVTQGDDGQAYHRATDSKVRFTMRDGKQVREKVEYQNSGGYFKDEPAVNLNWGF
jgi:hypothetical protein